MNSIIILFFIVVISNHFIFSLAKNNYYIISIRRDENDRNYDEATEEIQNEINELVNDRMNDIYNIIYDNKNTFTLENGKIDSKLNEFDLFKLKKRNKNFKQFRFLNRNRLLKNKKQNSKVIESKTLPLKKNNGTESFGFLDKNKTKIQYSNKIKRSNENNEYEIEIESNLVSHICPVLNYYAIKVYLSDSIIEEIKKIPNVINIEKSQKIKNASYKHYDINQIKKETKWSDVSVQEINYNTSHYYSYLSLISQDKYSKKNNANYDNNYYYPSSAGKDVDVYIIDNGLWVNNTDFDTYKGTKNERTISCDAIVSKGIIYPVEDKNKCIIKDISKDETIVDDKIYPEHGTMASSVVGGAFYGVAKQANIHMVATEYETVDDLTAFDYIKQNGKPHKTIINISRAGMAEFSESLQDKINELTKYGFIIIVAAGNDNMDCCKKNSSFSFLYSSYENVIKVGATGNYIDMTMEDVYARAYYSNFGSCIDIFAPGTVIYADSYLGYSNFTDAEGTSCAAPIVSGVAATLISEHPETKFTYESMKKLLIDLSIKDAISWNRDKETPNRFINNGKHSILEPFHCDDPSGKYRCQSGCCIENGICTDIDSTTIDKCVIENGCQTAFGQCLSFNYTDPSLTKEQRQLIVIHRCKKELEPFEICTKKNVNKFHNPIRSYQELEENCELYRRRNCKEFYYDPYKYAPSCKEAQQFEKFPLLDREKEFFDPISDQFNIDDEEFQTVVKRELIINNFLCEIEQPHDGHGHEKTCSISKSIYFNEYDNIQNLSKQNCYKKECHESYLEYIDYTLRFFENRKMEYDERYDIMKKIKEYLYSEECQLAYSSNNTSTKVITTSSPKSISTLNKNTSVIALTSTKKLTHSNTKTTS
eukprot:jgi/Orpsp1_1/1177451/evm.model.c7180000061478.1